MSRLPAAARRADRARQRAHVHVRRQERGGPRGRHDRLGAVRLRPAHLLAQLQVPPPARPALLRRPVPELPRAGGRRARRARLHRAGARGDEGRAHEREPSLDFDVMRATDLVGGPFTPPGFYYKTFIRPRRLWPLYEKVLRHAAGLGQAAQVAGRARVAHGVPAPPRGRPRDRRRRGRAERRARARPSWAPTWCSPTRAPSRAAALLAEGGPRARARAGRAGPRRRRRDPRPRARARLLRRPRAGLAGRHAPPGPRRAPDRTPPARSSSRCCSPATTCPA